MPRIQVLLDYPFTALYGEPFGMGTPAGSLRFAALTTDANGKAMAVPAGVTKGLWKVPSLGVVSLMPSFYDQGVLTADDPQYHGYQSTEFETATDDDGGKTLGFLGKVGTLSRTRKGPNSTSSGLTIGQAIQAALDLLSGKVKLKTVWRTVAMLKADEGAGLTVQPVRTYVDPNTKGYLALSLGGKYTIGIDLGGVGRLIESTGTDAQPKPIVRKTMDLAAAGIDLTKEFSVFVIPVGGRYLLMQFGNVRSSSFRGGRNVTNFVEKDFVFDSIDEGSGNYFDTSLNKYVVLPAGKFAISIQGAGTDYRLTPSKLRYDTAEVTAYFTGEPVSDGVEGVPDMEPMGYASGYTSGGKGTMDVVPCGVDGGAFQVGGDTLVPKLTMQASSDGIYPPELWYLNGHAYPKTYTPPYTQYDASQEWTYVRIQKTASMEPILLSVKLNEESRVGYVYRRGGPIRITIDGTPVADGYINDRRPTLGPLTMEAEYMGIDMWDRLKVPIGKFEAIDGQKLSDIVFKMLRRCGFTDAQIVIYDDLMGLTIEEFAEPQSLKVHNPNALVEDCLRDLAQKYTLQGHELLRVRWDGSAWQCYVPTTGATGDDPTTVFSSTDLIGPKGTDANRWSAGWYHITSALEWDVIRPEFNALRVSLTKASGDGGGQVEAYVDPRDEVLNDPTSQMFEGVRRTVLKTAPEVTATTGPGLLTQTRVAYDDAVRKVVGLGVQAEWQKEIDADMECAVVGLNPVTQSPCSWGVFRIEALDAEISQDEDVSTQTGVYLRSWEWSAAYRLRYLRPTSDSFKDPAGKTIPMYDGILPPPGNLQEGTAGGGDNP
jgi:hypothetical protein